MSASKFRGWVFVQICTLVGVSTMVVGGSGGVLSAQAQAGAELPEGEAKPVVARSCTGCHGLDLITSVKLPKETWREIVLEMRYRGADLTEEEVPLVIDYLAQHFGQAEQGQQEHKDSACSAGSGVRR